MGTGRHHLASEVGMCEKQEGDYDRTVLSVRAGAEDECLAELTEDWALCAM